MSDRAKRIILLILVILPFFFPYVSIRGSWQVPFGLDLNDDGSIFFLLFLIYAFCFPLYWEFVGYWFSHFGLSFKRSFFVGNIPVFFNLFGQLIYYDFFSVEGRTYPWFEYLLSSHLDKFDIFQSLSVSISAILAALCILAFFTFGYYFEKVL